MIYSNQYTIYSAMCDSTDHLTLWSLARIFQQVAEEHTSISKIGYSDLISQGKAWILSRMLYQINYYPSVNSIVTAKTWSQGANGLFAYREYELKNSIGETLASGSSYWALIDFNTRHVVRLNDIMDNYEHHSYSATGISELNKLHHSKELSPIHENVFKATYSTLDHTNHVNNSEYLRWICDSIPNPNKISTIEIDFLNETRLNDLVSVNQYSDNFIQIINPRGIAANAKLNFYD